MIRRVYDLHGNLAELTYHGENFALRLQPDKGYAMVRSAYDERGRQIEEAYYDENGDLLPQAGGYAVFRVAYDDNNNLTELAYFDAKLNPVFAARWIRCNAGRIRRKEP